MNEANEESKLIDDEDEPVTLTQE